MKKIIFFSPFLLTLMFLDDEHGAEYYSAANDRDQAKLVFECCRMMIENNPKLNQFVEVFKNGRVERGALLDVLDGGHFEVDQIGIVDAGSITSIWEGGEKRPTPPDASAAVSLGQIQSNGNIVLLKTYLFFLFQYTNQN